MTDLLLPYAECNYEFDNELRQLFLLIINSCCYFTCGDCTIGAMVEILKFLLNYLLIFQKATIRED